MSMNSKKEQALWISVPEEQGPTESDWVEYQARIDARLSPITKRSGTTSTTLKCWADELYDNSNLAIRQNGVMYQGISNVISSEDVLINVNYGNIDEVTYDNISKNVSAQTTQPSGLWVSSDGTRMFICDASDERVYQYNLSTPWDVSSASYSKNFSISSQTINPDGMCFKPDGTKMYISDISNGNVYQYHLSTPWELDTASYYTSKSVSKSIDSISFSSDGTRMYFVDSSEYVYQYNLSTAWNITSATEHSNFYVGSQDSNADDLTFHPNGTRMYYTGIGTNTIYQYTLSTPWEVSTASYDNKSFPFGSYDGQPDAVVFDPEKTRMYMVGSNSDTVYQFSIPKDVEEYRKGIDVDITNFQLSIAPQYVFNGIPDMTVCLEDNALRCVSTDTEMFIESVATDQLNVMYNDVLDQIIEIGDTIVIDSGEVDVNSISDSGTTSNAPSYTSTSHFVGSQDASPVSFSFRPNGMKLFVLGDNNNTIYQYSLSSAWDLLSVSYDNVSASVSAQDTSPQSFSFNENGTKLYVIGYSSDKIHQYSLSIAWDLSSMSYDDISFDVSFQEITPRAMRFNPDGTRFYLVGNNDRVYQYNVLVPWDISRSEYTGASYYVGSQEASATSIDFNSDGSKMYIAGYSSDSIHQYDLDVRWDVSSATYSGNNYYIGTEDNTPQSVAFSPDGSALFMVGSSTDTLYKYSATSFSLGGDMIWEIGVPLGGTTPTFVRIKDRSMMMPYDTTAVFGDVYSYAINVSTLGSMSHTFDSVDRRQTPGRGIQLGVIADKGTRVDSMRANLWKT